MDKIWHLKRIRILAHLKESELAAVGERSRMCELPARQLVYAAGDPDSSVYLLKEGQVRLFRTTEDGKEITLAILDPGDIFGEGEAVRPNSRRAYAETLTVACVCILSRQDFLEMIRHHPELSLEIASLMGQRLEESWDRLEQLAYRDVASRLAIQLLQWAQEKSHGREAEVTVHHGLTHQQLASLLGTSRETLTLTLNRLVDAGLISTGRGFVTLRDPAALQAMAQNKPPSPSLSRRQV